MQGQARIAANAADGLNFIQGIDAAGFRGLRDADAGRLHGVHVTHLAPRLLRQFNRVDLGVSPAQQHQAGAMGVELGCAAFIVGDMALRVAQHGAPGRRQRGQAERIGGCAGGHEQHVDLVLEQIGKPALHIQGAVVGAIRLGLAGAGAQQRFHYFGAGARDVVAGKAHIGGGDG
ncbi:hypothetical protein D3C71_1516940 [compost metagenome]